MSRNGAGSYSLPTPQNPVVTNTTVTSDWANTTLNDIATELTNSLPRDGQAAMNANLPMGGFKLTGLGSGVSNTDSVNYGQVFNSPAFVTPTATTSPTLGDNSLKLATTAFVVQQAFATALPAQSGNAGKFVTTNGTSASWAYAGISTINATVTTDTALSGSYLYVPVAMTALGKSVALPSALTLSVGGPQYVIDNTKGGYPVGIRDNTGTLLMAVAPGGEALVSLKDNTTAAGVWSVTGSNLEPGLITIDSTFSSTYASTVLAPFVALDNNTSIHFAALSSGFAAFVVDNTGKVLTTPVTIDATASSVPVQAFKISATSAIVFFGVTNTCKAVVISLSGSSPSLSLSVGTAQTATAASGNINGVWDGEDFKSAPKIAQLSSTLYLASFTTGSVVTTGCVAISVSGSVITIGAGATIVASAVTTSTTTYALTATTALVLYLSGAGAPYTVNAVVVSVSGTTCTVGAPASATGAFFFQASAPASTLLSATKLMVADDGGASNNYYVTPITVSAGTTVTFGTRLAIETAMGSNNPGIANFTGNSATRYNSHFWPIGANTAGLWYLDGNGISRTVVLTESGGTLTAGTILYRSISSAGATATDGGQIAPQGTAEFIAFKQEGVASAWKTRAIAHKISGTVITVGSTYPLLEIPNTTKSSGTDMTVCRLASGDYIPISTQNGGLPALPVFRSNGDTVAYRGKIAAPAVIGLSFFGATPGYPAVAGNRVVVIGHSSVQGTTIGASTYQLRLINVEIAA